MSHGTPCAFIAGRVGIEMARSERAHLVQGARRHHGVEAGVDATQQRVAIGHEKDFCGKRRIDARRHVRFVPLQNRASGRQDHFKRASDAGAVTGHQPRRGGGIAPRQFGMQCLDAVAGEPTRAPHCGFAPGSAAPRQALG